MPRKPISIEKLLQWVYRDELPKQAVGGLTGWEQLILLGTRVDSSHQDATFPAVMGAPHPDALLVDCAVRHKLPESFKLEWPRGRDELLGELGCWIADDDQAAVRTSTNPIALVMMHARMGTRPKWSLRPLSLLRIVGKNGKPVVDGLTLGHRYAIGASCPLRLDPPAPRIAHARFEWRVWHAALVALASEITGLAEYAPTPPEAASHPWAIDDEEKPRVINDEPTSMLRVVNGRGSMKELPLKPTRGLMGPPMPRPRNSKVRIVGGELDLIACRCAQTG